MVVVKFYTNRSEYGAFEATKNSMTVDELIEYLQQFDGDAKVIFSNDRGYTYGYVNDGYIDEDEIEEEE